MKVFFVGTRIGGAAGLVAGMLDPAGTAVAVGTALSS